DPAVGSRASTRPPARRAPPSRGTSAEKRETGDALTGIIGETQPRPEERPMARPRTDAAVTHLYTILQAGRCAGLTDGELLERFVSRRGTPAAEQAFEALVMRHARLVRGVCRDLLGDEPDVDDAFQATFVILVRRAGSLWVRDSLGPWL